jgi:hypothetical protein
VGSARRVPGGLGAAHGWLTGAGAVAGSAPALRVQPLPPLAFAGSSTFGHGGVTTA